MVIDGIFFRTRTGCRWRDLPGEYGNWKTVCNRHRRWSLDGSRGEILGRLRAGCDEAEGRDWTVSADSAVVRAHQHAAGARHALPAELVKGGTAGWQESGGPAGPGGAGPVPRRAEHQDSPGRRPPVPPGQPDPHRRPAWRLPAVHPAAGAGPHRPPRERTAAYPARPGDGRQGVLIGGQRLLSTPPRHRRRHPGQGGAEETPPRPRPGRRPPARLRRRTLQTARHRRALL